MTLPASGPITMQMVATELGIGATGLNLNDSRVRALAGRPSGAISMADLRGKSNYIPMSLSLWSNESGISDPLQWFPRVEPVSNYVYNCSIQAIVSNGKGPFSYVFSKQGGTGTFTYNNDVANWAISINRFQQPGLVTAGNITCVVTDSTGQQISLTVAAQVEATV